MTANAVLYMNNIRMKFGQNEVLKGVSIAVKRGEVFGLLGQNGSGKSTLIKILAGFHQPEKESEIILWGQKMTLPLDAMAIKSHGVAFVHQHLALVATLTVAENMRVTALDQKTPWRVSWKKETARLRQLFAEFDLEIDPTKTIAELAPVERAFVAIIRAFEDLRASEAGYGGEGILVLDEPTPFLPPEDVERLFTLIRRIVKTGASVIIVTHDIDEVRDITDRVAILRDGELVDILETEKSSRQDILDTIVGSRIDAFSKERMSADLGSATIKIEDLDGNQGVPFSFNIAKGEIVGVTGLIGSGFSDIPYMLYGAQRANGKITIDGTEIRLSGLQPRQAQAAGIALLPGDRLGAAGFGSLSVVDNSTLPILTELSGLLGLNKRNMLNETQVIISAYDVRPKNPSLLLGALSGGNQQKVLLAKWLRIKPKLMLLDEPTQGVDFGARQQIFSALDAAAREGTSILCASTDHEQLEQICDRIIVFAKGRPVVELSGNEINRKAITEACFYNAAMEAAE